MRYIDLFAGAGGLSEGFLRAGFKPVAHVEMNPSACDTLRTRMVYHHLAGAGQLDIYHDYLQKRITREQLWAHAPAGLLETVINKEITNESIKSVFDEIDALVGNEPVDLLLGGPPCQAYSIAGRSADNKRDKEDLRKRLYEQYGKFLMVYRPKAFVFENVPGMLNANKGQYFQDLKEYFTQIGYKIDYDILDTSDYGVLQRRQRVIIVGWNEKLKFTYPVARKVKHTWKVNSLLNDLKPLTPGEANDYCDYAGEASNYLKHFNLRGEEEFVTQHTTRPHNEKDLSIYKMAIEHLADGKRLKNNAIPAEQRTQKNVTAFLDRFKVVKSDDLAHTMLAHIAKDGHYYIHPSAEQCRSLSVREAARIQSFPDNYFFEGSRSAAFLQIGNAVPPLMAEAIANEIKYKLHESVPA
jgi:DNA (cytosine-5)-methyltransferase 1